MGNYTIVLVIVGVFFLGVFVMGAVVSGYFCWVRLFRNMFALGEDIWFGEIFGFGYLSWQVVVWGGSCLGR